MIEIPDKISVALWGGMGDFFKRYLLHPSFGCLKDLKIQHPNITIRAVINSQTRPAVDLLDYNPYIDEVIKLDKHPKDYYFLRNNEEIYNQFKVEKPKIYLSKEDINFVNSVVPKKYICLHPFCGTGSENRINGRAPLTPGEYKMTVDNLIDLGYDVVILGGSYEKTSFNGKRTTVKEHFPYKRKGVINLIGETNVRTGAEIIRRADGFIGTASAWRGAAWCMEETDSYIILTKAWKEKMERRSWTKTLNTDGRHKTLYLDKNRDIKKISDDIASWFR